MARKNSQSIPDLKQAAMYSIDDRKDVARAVPDSTPLSDKERHWFHLWAATFGFPDTYVALNVKSIGSARGGHLIVEIGLCPVRNRQPQESVRYVLDWTRDPSIDQEWLRRHLKQTKQEVEYLLGEPTGRVYLLDCNLLATEGKEPHSVLTTVHDIIHSNHARTPFVVTHHGPFYELSPLEDHFCRYVDSTFAFRDDQFIATGMLSKASQLDWFPDPTETPASFYGHVFAMIRSAAYWDLDPFCMVHFDLKEQIDRIGGRTYRADQNAFIEHLLFETFRQLAESADDEPDTRGQAGNGSVGTRRNKSATPGAQLRLFRP